MKAFGRFAAALTAAVLATGAPAGAGEGPDAATIARDAYIYLYPLVTMEVTRKQLTNLPPSSGLGGPMNVFVNLPGFPTAEMKTVVRPNFDTLYSSAWLDLTGGPLVVSAPDTKGRYYLLPMLDMWTDVFASPGWRTTGTAAADYLVTPPGWSGAVPAGLTRIAAPTPTVWIIGRTKTDGPADYPAVHEVQAGFRVTPLAAWGRAPEPPPVQKIDPAVDVKTPPKLQVDAMSGPAFFAMAAELLRLHPPHLTDEPILAQMKRLGLVPGAPFDASAQSPAVKAAIDALRAKGLIYEGRLEKPKGHEDEEWEDREQTLFKSTEFGDEADRALMKSDGSYTYFAGDVAYHYDKLQRGYRHLVNVFGADHIGYIPRMLAVVAAFTGGTVERDAKGKLKSWATSGGSADLAIKVVNLVKLFKNGEPYKMSKRAGTFVTLRDVVDEVGRDPVRFMMLYRKELEPLDFDFAKVTEQSKDNPVFYVQYAHARAASVFRNAQEVFPELSPDSPAVLGADLSRLDDAGEIDLIKKIAFFPRLIEGAAKAEEPHRLAFYLYELSSALHGQWSRGNDSPHLRFIQAEDGVMTAARLALIAAVQQVISSGLSVLGVEAPESMR